MVPGILIDENGELLIDVKRDDLGYITEGIKVGDTLLQDQNLLLRSHPGEWKENPIVGVGIEDYMNDDSSVEELHYTIERQYKMCGLNIISLTGSSPMATKITAERNE